MSRWGAIFVFFCALATCAVRARKNNTGLVPVDELRKEFLQLEEKMWDFVLDRVDNGIPPKEGRAPEVELIEGFEKFGDKMFEVKKTKDGWKSDGRVVERRLD